MALPCGTHELIVIELASARRAYPSARLTAASSLPLSSSVATRTVVSVPAEESGDAVEVVTHSRVPTLTLTTLQLASSVEPPLSTSVTRTRAVFTAKPVPVMVNRTPPAADPLLGLTAARLRDPETATDPACDAYPIGGTWTRMGDGETVWGQSGIAHMMLVAVNEATRQGRPSHTVTVGAPVPLAKPAPVRVRVVLSSTTDAETAVSVGVTAWSNEKLDGRLCPFVESEAGSEYMLAIEKGGALPQSWSPNSAEEHVALQLAAGASTLCERMDNERVRCNRK